MIVKKYLVGIAGIVLLASLTGCGAGMSASDQKICDFVASYPSELLVPTDMEELAQYMSLTGQEKFEVRRDNAWYVHDQWETNVDTAAGLRLMSDESTDGKIQQYLAGIELALANYVLDGEIYMSADVPNAGEQARLTSLLAAEAKATGLYKDIAFRCVELNK